LIRVAEVVVEVVIVVEVAEGRLLEVEVRGRDVDVVAEDGLWVDGTVEAAGEGEGE
jgi:hypothetical protein